MVIISTSTVGKLGTTVTGTIRVLLVAITKGITIDGTTGAGFGSILAAGFNGIIVNDTSGNGVVTLRNLYFNGVSNGTGNGIRFLAGKALVVEGCSIFGFTGNPASNQGR